jgi:hypothetical protein
MDDDTIGQVDAAVMPVLVGGVIPLAAPVSRASWPLKYRPNHLLALSMPATMSNGLQPTRQPRTGGPDDG